MASRFVRGGFVAVLLVAVLVQSFNAPATSAAAALHYLYGSGSQTGGKDITLRIELTEPAPSGGAVVSLAASNPAISVPATTTISNGDFEKTITVATSPVATNMPITVSATYAGVTKSRSVLMKAPVLTSLGLQSVIRHGGVGKVIARISGPAPVGGFPVSTSANPDGYLGIDPVIIVLEGQIQLSMPVSANLFGPADIALPDQPLSLTISAGSASFTKSTIIRDFGDDPRPTPTATDIPLPPSGNIIEFELVTSANPVVGEETAFNVHTSYGGGGFFSIRASDGGETEGLTYENFYPGPSSYYPGATFTRDQPGEVWLIATIILPGTYDPEIISVSVTYVLPPTATITATASPSNTPTNTPLPPTNTPTNTATNTNTPVLPTNTPTISNQPSGIQVIISLATNPTLIVGEFTMVDVCIINTIPGKDATLSFTISDGGNPGGEDMDMAAANDFFCGDSALVISRLVPGEYWVTATLHVAGYVDQVFESPHFTYLPANTPTPTSTQDPISDGCEYFNSGAADGPIDTAYAEDIQLFQGETIFFSTTGSAPDVRVRFRDNTLNTISTSNFSSPGGSFYTIPFTQVWGEVEWTGFGSTVTWDFSCTPAP